ncbi:MAG: hypothetical protein WD875_11015 [Pirellulales bacterium]
MCQSIALLNRTLEVYGEQAEVESWKKDHADAMRCFNLQDLISQGLWMAERLDARSDDGRISVTLALDLCRLLKQWYKHSTSILAQAAILRGKDYEIDGYDELKSEVDRIGCTLRSLDSVTKVLEDVRHNRGVLLEDLVNEVCDSASGPNSGTPAKGSKRVPRSPSRKS